MRYQFNDAGRSTSKRPKQTNDCVVRAVALAANGTYDDVYNMFKQLGRECSKGVRHMIWQSYLNSSRLFERISFPAVKGQSRMNLERFTNEFIHGAYIVQCAGHLTVVINGVVNDAFEPRHDACVYAVWRKTAWRKISY